MAWEDHYDLYGDPVLKEKALRERKEWSLSVTERRKKEKEEKKMVEKPAPTPNVHSEAGLLGPYDVSSEAKRTYTYLHVTAEGGTGNITKTIHEPVKLWIKHKDGKTGSHRVLDAAGDVHYMPEDWKFLTWTPKEGKPAVEF